MNFSVYANTDGVSDRLCVVYARLMKRMKMMKRIGECPSDYVI